MKHPDDFDAFYKEARDRLLLQTYALTGDLPASRSAVRDSFIVAWHHWRKVSRLAEPEGYVRPYAWAHAQRRHTARLWHRDKGLDADTRATLDALGKLPVTQRKALLLTHLATVSMADLAREVGLPRAEAERQLQTATAQFAVHRDVRTTHIRPLFDSLRTAVESVRWPRPSILRRAGAARRRTHTLIGAGVAVAALVATGTVVTDAAGVRPTLLGSAAARGIGNQAGAESSPAPEKTEPAPPEFSGDALLAAAQVADRVPGKGWTVRRTDDNTQGDGLVFPCQRARFADPRGRAAVVRTFGTAQPRKGNKGGKARNRPSPAAMQMAELSTSRKSARKAYNTALGWYAGCAEPRVQLMSTKQVQGVADDALLLVLRAWDRPGWTYVTGVARTGKITTTTMTKTPVDQAPGLPSAARLLAQAVDELCDQPAAGTCVDKPRLAPSPPVPTGAVPGMLAEIDLPPVTRVTKPWVGTEPRKAVTNVAATSCDRADFNQRGMSNNLTRSFLIPEAKLADQFGLTQSVATMPARRARAFVEKIRRRMASCSDRDLGTDVTRLAHRDNREQDLSVWRVRTELSDNRSVTFLMGVAREGTAVAQLGFVPDARVTMPTRAFISLLERGSQRLRSMPEPG